MDNSDDLVRGILSIGCVMVLLAVAACVAVGALIGAAIA